MKSIAIMTENHLHIISFDVPYPANYGGVIDVFYRVKALTEASRCICIVLSTVAASRRS